MLTNANELTFALFQYGSNSVWFGLSGLKTQHKFLKSGVGWFEKVALCLNLMFSSFQDPSRESTVLCTP